MTQNTGTKSSIHILNKAKMRIVGNSIWMVPVCYEAKCALVELDIDTGELLTMDYFPEKEGRNCLQTGIAFANGYLFFSPGNGKKIWKYDIEHKNFIEMDMNLTEEEINLRGGRFSNIIQYQNQLFLFGMWVEGIIKYDLDTGNVKRYTEHHEELNPKERFAPNGIYATKSILIEDKIYYLCQNFRTVIIFDMINESCSIFDIDTDEDVVFSDIEYENGQFILYGVNEKAYIWETGTSRAELCGYLTGRELQNKWLIEAGEFTNASDISYIEKKDNRILLQNELTGNVYLMDIEEDEYRLSKLPINHDKVALQVLKKDGIVAESDICSLNSLISVLTECDIK